MFRLNLGTKEEIRLQYKSLTGSTVQVLSSDGDYFILVRFYLQRRVLLKLDREAMYNKLGEFKELEDLLGVETIASSRGSVVRLELIASFAALVPHLEASALTQCLLSENKLLRTVVKNVLGGDDNAVLSFKYEPCLTGHH